MFLMDDFFSLQKQLKKTKDPKERLRLCVILARNNGHSIKVISSILQISESSVYEYINEFHHENKTTNKIYLGRACKLSKSQENELISYIAQHSYKSVEQLSAYILKKYNIKYTNSGLRDWLKRKSLKKIRKKRLSPHKHDFKNCNPVPSS